jgi:hypothetical protein
MIGQDRLLCGPRKIDLSTTPRFNRAPDML